jgi:hypothetical protein
MSIENATNIATKTLRIAEMCRQVSTYDPENYGDAAMTWTTTSLILQTVAGLAGAHFAAIALHEHRFGWLAHSLVGLAAGALSGYFLQTIALTVVTGSGSMNEVRGPDVIVIQILTGAVVGAIAMAAVGFLAKPR